jgi:hypothetical protein
VVGISGQILAAWLKARLVFLTNPDGANAWVEETAKTERRAAADRRMLIVVSIVIMYKSPVVVNEKECEKDVGCRPLTSD